MPRHRDMLNVREHLEHAELIAQGFAKYGMCPAIRYELNKFFLINRAIMRKADAKRKAGNRHDVYVGRRNHAHN